MWSSAGASEASVKERLDEALAPFRSRFADVPVATLSPGADPAAVLIRESVGAALLVVGTRGRAARSRLSHVAGRTVARWARCPVVLVPSGKDAADAHAGSGRRAALSGTDPTGIEPVQRPRTPWE
jgi:nucleotide-binding universal stress UspA family protein